MKSTLFALAGLVVLLGSACAPAPATPDPAQIQASAVAAASTMIAMTQAAVPTPTDTPTLEPSPTPMPLPTLDLLPTISAPTVAPTSSTGDDCNHLFDLNATGKARAKVVIRNNTKGPLTFTLSMGTKNAFGQCGYLSWSNLPKMADTTVYVPQTGTGPCYWGFAIINDPKHPRFENTGPFCMNNPDKWLLTVDYNTIRLTPP